MTISKSQTQSYYSECKILSVRTSDFLLDYKCKDYAASKSLEDCITKTVESMPTGGGAKFGVEFQRTYGSNTAIYLGARFVIAPIETALGKMTRQPQPSDWKGLASTIERVGEIPLNTRTLLHKRIDEVNRSAGRRY